MKNEFLPQTAIVTKISRETSSVKLFTLRFSPQRKLFFNPGQFVLVSPNSAGEIPLGIASASFGKSSFDIAVREVGTVTSMMHQLKVGDKVGVRGPYGNGWPLEKIKGRNVLLIAGGIGIVPFRAFIQSLCEERKNFGKVQLFYGSRNKQELIFKKEINDWCENIDVHLSFDMGKVVYSPFFSCDIGLITTLFERIKLVENAVAFVCGPPIMCKFVLDKLFEHKFKDEDIYLSLERRMDCGIGICQHCAVGPYYVCKDGPVFSWQEIKNIPGVIM